MLSPFFLFLLHIPPEHFFLCHNPQICSFSSDRCPANRSHCLLNITAGSALQMFQTQHAFSPQPSPKFPQCFYNMTFHPSIKARSLGTMLIFFLTSQYLIGHNILSILPLSTFQIFPGICPHCLFLNSNTWLLLHRLFQISQDFSLSVLFQSSLYPPLGMAHISHSPFLYFLSFKVPSVPL